MTGFSGFVKAALQLGLDAKLYRPTRGIYEIKDAFGNTLPDILADVVVEEHHSDELEVTDHPVQQGAMITDHAFKRPAEVVLKLGWSNSPSGRGSMVNAAIAAASSANPIANKVAGAVGIYQGALGIQSAMTSSNVQQIADIYNKLLRLQELRALFWVYTGKRVYSNMICKSLTTETDYKSEHDLLVTMVCKQVILVDVETVKLPKIKQANPELTCSQASVGAVSATAKEINGFF